MNYHVTNLFFIIIIFLQKNTSWFCYTNVVSIYNTHHTKHSTPIFEIQHDNLHLITHKLIYEFSKHCVDYHYHFTQHIKTITKHPIIKNWIQVKMFTSCANLLVTCEIQIRMKISILYFNCTLIWNHRFCMDTKVHKCIFWHPKMFVPTLITIFHQQEMTKPCFEYDFINIPTPHQILTNYMTSCNHILK